MRTLNRILDVLVPARRWKTRNQRCLPVYSWTSPRVVVSMSDLGTLVVVDGVHWNVPWVDPHGSESPAPVTHASSPAA